MSVVVTLVTVFVRCMDRNLYGCVISINQLPPNITRQFFTLQFGQLTRQSNFHLPCNSCIATGFSGFGRVPQSRRIKDPSGRPRWGKDFKGGDTTSFCVVLDYSQTVVLYANTGTISGSGGGTVALRSAYAIYLTMVYRHAHNSAKYKTQKNHPQPHRKANRHFGVSGA